MPTGVYLRTGRHKRLQSIGLKNKWRSDSKFRSKCLRGLRRIHKSRLGKKMPDGWHRKVQASIRKFVKLPGYSAMRSKLTKNLWKSSEFRQKVTKAQNSEAANCGRKVAMRKTSNRLWKQLWYREMRSEFASRVLGSLMKDQKHVAWLNSLRSSCRPSKVQRYIFQRLCCAGFRGLRLEYSVGTFRIDIAFPRRKLAIEVDGEYWHRDRQRADLKKSRYLRKLGWRVIRIPAEKGQFSKLTRLLGVRPL